MRESCSREQVLIEATQPGILSTKFLSPSPLSATLLTLLVIKKKFSFSCFRFYSLPNPSIASRGSHLSSLYRILQTSMQTFHRSLYCKSLIKVALLVLTILVTLTVAFSSPSHHLGQSRATSRTASFASASSAPLWKPLTKPSLLTTLRGGDQSSSTEEEIVDFDEDDAVASDSLSETEEVQSLDAEDPVPSTKFASGTFSLASMSSFLSSLGAKYGHYIEQYPIATKSLTAGFIFGLSDYCAQRLENRKTAGTESSKKAKVPASKAAPSINLSRLMWSTAVGLCYFGPAAHYWYEGIFRFLPGTGLFSTLQKAALGQLIFGPSFTCIFFATSLIQANKFSMRAWYLKIKQDLPGAWLAGVGYWPIVDLISYSVVPMNYIPLFVNMCSFVWTIYLSLVANR